MSDLLHAQGISKEFTGVVALDNVDFTLKAGEIHALMGENGAGKSTLIKVLTGVYEADSGTVSLQGKPIRITSPQDAVAQGISTVYQEINLAPNLSVAENICLGREPRGFGGIKWREIKKRAEAALDRLGVQLDVTKPLGSYSVALQQLAAIARALDVSCQVLILDEPTSSLDKHEVDQLFAVMRRLRSEGMGIVFVTHFIEQVYAVSDRITVLRNGKLVGTYDTASFDRLSLVSAMIGRDASELTTVAETRNLSEGKPFVSANEIGRKNSVEGVSFQIAPGEVLGFAGLLGSGRTETIRMLFGIDTPSHGALEIDGRTVWRPSTAAMIKAGFGLCPEDRKAEGILPDLSVRENLMLVVQSKRGWWRRISKREQEATVDRFIQQLRIATSDAEKPIQFLSGGNQQKVLLARWLAANPRLLLLDEPTRGIDVGAKFEISNLVEQLRQEGMAFVFVSSELEEVVRSSTKVVVLRDRHMVGELKGAEITEERVMGAIAGDGS
ncbi:MAG: sugar ABC transporter ATP-binding protein [Fimbriimonas sp.]